jgi:sulfopropanediol 3-dehydrogenase
VHQTDHPGKARRAVRLRPLVGKFMRTVTCQECTPEASVVIGDYCSRLCAIEQFRAHKEQADLRLWRYGGRKVGLGPGTESVP